VVVVLDCLPTALLWNWEVNEIYLRQRSKSRSIARVMSGHGGPPVVILCGGKGKRLRPLTEDRPKPILQIGEKPIVEHIMDGYSRYGFDEFILCVGYRADEFARYFESEADSSGTVSEESTDSRRRFRRNGQRITLADTGRGTSKTERLLDVKDILGSERFFVTYGDGLADIDVDALLERHLAAGKTGTVTGVRARSPFGILETDGTTVSAVREKPLLSSWINGGFFVFETDVYEYISPGDSLEGDVLNELADDGELAAYRHDGFFKGIDTQKDLEEARTLYETDERPPWAGE
jgi:glucose-1-phosphate cytidylyltransferase